MMVKYISFMIILGVSLLFTSCVYHFDLDEAEGIPKLVVYSYPGSGDTTVVCFSRSLPVTGKGEIVSGLTGTDVRLEVKEKVSLSDIFVHTAIDFRSSPVTAQITSEITLTESDENVTIRQYYMPKSTATAQESWRLLCEQTVSADVSC